MGETGPLQGVEAYKDEMGICVGEEEQQETLQSQPDKKGTNGKKSRKESGLMQKQEPKGGEEGNLLKEILVRGEKGDPTGVEKWQCTVLEPQNNGWEEGGGQREGDINEGGKIVAATQHEYQISGPKQSKENTTLNYSRTHILFKYVWNILQGSSYTGL